MSYRTKIPMTRLEKRCSAKDEARHAMDVCAGPKEYRRVAKLAREAGLFALSNALVAHANAEDESDRTWNRVDKLMQTTKEERDA